MLNTLISRLPHAIAATTLLATGDALAHPGAHLELSNTGLLQHLLASPYHGLPIIGALLAVAILIWKVNHPRKSD